MSEDEREGHVEPALIKNAGFFTGNIINFE